VVEALNTVKSNQKTDALQIRIGFPDSYYYIPYYNIIKEAVTQFCNVNPKTEITETIYSYDNITMSLINKETDIIVGQSVFLNRLKDAEVIDLISTTTYIVISQNHPLAANDTIEFHKLENETLYAIKVADENEQRKNINILNKTLNFSPKDVVLVPNTFSLLHAINAGKGIAFFAQVDNITTSMALKYYPFPDEFGGAAKTKIGAAWLPRYASNELQFFLDILIDTAMGSDYH